MVAIREEIQLNFYQNSEYDRMEAQARDLYRDTIHDAGYSLDLHHNWDVPLEYEISVNMIFPYTKELIMRQAEYGDLIGIITQEEAALALQDVDEYENMVESIYEFIDYNGSFQRGVSGVELDFLKDILYSLDRDKMFRMKSHEEVVIDMKENYYIAGGEVLEAVHSPLQEVW